MIWHGEKEQSKVMSLSYVDEISAHKFKVRCSKMLENKFLIYVALIENVLSAEKFSVKILLR